MPNQYTKKRETEAALAEKAMRQELAGIPDSKPFADPDAVYDSRLVGCHVGGVPVENLPVELRARLRFELTDEGILLSERELAAKAAAGQVSRITMESDEDTEKKRFGPMKDQLMAGAEPWEVDNPMQSVMDAHLPPGHRGRWLDEQVRSEVGMDGWKPVLDEKGNKVMCGQSFLGSMPEDRAQARDDFYARKAENQLTRVKGEVQEQADRLSHAQKRAGGVPDVGPSPVPAGLHITRDINELVAHESRQP